MLVQVQVEIGDDSKEIARTGHRADPQLCQKIAEEVARRLQVEVDALKAYYLQITDSKVEIFTNVLDFGGIEIFSNDEEKLTRAVRILDACEGMDSGEVVDMMDELKSLTPPEEDEQ